MPLNLPFPGFATALGPSRALARLRHERAAAIVLQGHAVEILEMRPEGVLAARLDGEVDRCPAGGEIEEITDAATTSYVGTQNSDAATISYVGTGN